MDVHLIVPFWGAPELLFQTVDSVREQTRSDWRLTVLDDAYPDPEARTATFLERLDDDRISYVRNPHNLGITDNYRQAVRIAEEEFVTFLGCDDLLRPNFLDVVARTVAAVPDADVIQPGVEVIDEHGRVTRPLVDRVKQRLLAPRTDDGPTVLRGERMATSLIRGNWLYWPSLTFRTATLRRFDFRDGLPIIQDLALLMDIAFAGGTLAYNPEVAFAYRRHSDSSSQTALLDGRRFEDERAYFALARRIALDHAWPRTASGARWRLMSRLHAVTELPGVVRRGTRAGRRSTVRHIVAR